MIVPLPDDQDALSQLAFTAVMKRCVDHIRSLNVLPQLRAFPTTVLTLHQQDIENRHLAQVKGR